MAISPFKVIQCHRFCTNRKPTALLSLAINTNLPPILHRFQVMAVYIGQIFASDRGCFTLTPSLGIPCEYPDELQKLEWLSYVMLKTARSSGRYTVTLTDRRTDRRTDSPSLLQRSQSALRAMRTSCKNRVTSFKDDPVKRCVFGYLIWNNIEHGTR